MARARADFPNLDYGLWRLNNENILSPESELEVFQKLEAKPAQKSSVADPERFAADPDPALQADADPDPKFV